MWCLVGAAVKTEKKPGWVFFCFMEDETVWWNFGGNFLCCHRLYPPTCCSRREPLRRINLSSTFFFVSDCFFIFIFMLFFFFYFSLLRMCLEFISAPFTVSRRGTSALARQGIQLITHNSGGDPSSAHPSADPFTQRGALLPRCLCSTAPELFLPVAQPLAQID